MQLSALVALPPLLMHEQGADGAAAKGAAGATDDALHWMMRVDPLGAAVVALAGGHALLHAYHIATWWRPWTREVIEMSAVRSLRDRRRRFPAGHVLHYAAGTAFDIGSHAMMAALLARRVAGAS